MMWFWMTCHLMPLAYSENSASISSAVMGFLVGHSNPPLQEVLWKGRVQLVDHFFHKLPAEHAVSIALENAAQIFLDFNAEGLLRP